MDRHGHPRYRTVRKVHFFAYDPAHSDACYVRAYHHVSVRAHRFDSRYRTASLHALNHTAVGVLRVTESVDSEARKDASSRTKLGDGARPARKAGKKANGNLVASRPP